MGTIIMDAQTGPYGKLFVIPQDLTDREFLLSVDRRTRVDIETKYGIAVDYDWQCNTIANCMVETIISNLAMLLKNGAGSGVGISFYDILTAVVTVKTNSKAEKEGNINIYFESGDRAKYLIENGPSEYTGDKIDPRVQFITGNPEDDDLYKNLEYHCKYNLSTMHNIMFPEHLKFAAFAIGYTFIENLYIEILYRLANMTTEEGEEGAEKLVSVNFNDNIEFHGVLKDGTVSITLRPGMNAKLLIKCDEITEHTMGDDE